MGQYLPILFLGVLAGLFALVSILASHILAPKKPNPIKQAPYECGVDPIAELPERFPVKFFLVAMIFIVFDVEIIFFYPWAVSFGALGLFGLVAVLIFSFAVLETFLYLISHGALNWGAASWVTSKIAARSAERELLESESARADLVNTGSTIRRISNKEKAKVHV